MPCFNVGQMKALTYTELNKYSLAADTFIRINNFNKAVVVKRNLGDKTASYYVFKEGEHTLYRKGQFVLTQNDPTNAALYQSVLKV